MMEAIQLTMLIVYGVAFVAFGIAAALMPLWYKGPE
jgi:hypothetical protein